MIRPARTGEAAALSALALRSKASWGYPGDMVQAFREELTLSPDQLGDVYVAERDGTVVGFHSLQPISELRVELGHLFVEPALRGQGLGHALMEDALHRARGRGFAVMEIQGDPHAAAFYERLGARRVGERESDSIAGRMLPLYEVALDAAPGPPRERFDPGETVVVRNVANSDGSVTRALPAIAVDDGPQWLVVFVPDGTRFKDKRFAPGAAGALAAEAPWVDRVWQGRSMLRVFQAGVACSFGFFFSRTGELEGYYGDLHTPFVRTPIGVDTRDHALDVIASPDGSWAWKDEAQLARRLELGIDSARHQSQVRAAGEAFIERLTRQRPPFGRGWETWKPPAEWEPRALPSAWADDHGSRAHLPATTI